MKTLSYQDAKMLKFWDGIECGTVVHGYRLEEFGERINTILPDLISSGLLKVTTGYDNVPNYQVPDLKLALKNHGLSVTGKKADLVDRIRNNFDDNELDRIFSRSCYMLTDEGKRAIDFFEIFFLNEKYSCDFMSEELAQAKKLYPNDIPLEQLRRHLLQRYSKEYASGSPNIFSTCDSMVNILKKKNDYQNMLLFMWTLTYYEMCGCSRYSTGEFYVYSVRFPLNPPRFLKDFDLCKSALGWSIDEFCNFIRNRAFSRAIAMPFSFFTNDELLRIVCDNLTGNAKPITPQFYQISMPQANNPYYTYYDFSD